MTQTVALDTCVLFPMYLRDTLLRLAVAGLYRPIWSAGILEELRTALIREGMSNPDQTTRMIDLMREHFPDAETSGYEELVESLACDPGDRHVLAAAIRGGATCLATANGRDFPRASVSPYGIEVLSPDDFLLDLFDLAPSVVISTLHTQAGRYKREPTSIHGLLISLSRSGASGFADEVRRYVR